MVSIEREKPIWEQYGITLEEYANTFNEVLEDEYEKAIKGKAYFVNVSDGKPTVHRITNIKVQ